MIWLYPALLIFGVIIGCICNEAWRAGRSGAIGTLNVVHWNNGTDDLLLQLDNDTSELHDGQNIVLNVKCSRR